MYSDSHSNIFNEEDSCDFIHLSVANKVDEGN
jgi:hypothetical protein